MKILNLIFEKRKRILGKQFVRRTGFEPVTLSLEG